MFYAIAFMILLSSSVVVFSTNIIYSVFSLLISLLGVAFLYAFLGADFLAVTQLILYVGGVLVLILFAVMLTNKISEISISNAHSSKIPAAIIAVLCFVGLSAMAISTFGGESFREVRSEPTTAKIGEALTQKFYVLPFEVISVLILVSLIGAVCIVRPKLKEDE